ncbi:MAG: dephospho-CoA kinase [Bacteroidetes bacterium]|nr:dephospho-CoA kinase [Bacteroidota bacterium]
MKIPLQIGVTGGIGAGKSIICRIFQSFGVPVYDADGRAKELMTTDGILVNQIKKEFGELSYRGDGSLDRSHLGKATFGHPERLSVLNALVHPQVAADYQSWLHLQIGRKYVVREAALLFEAGATIGLDKIIVVAAPEELRIRRVLARDSHRTLEDVRAILKNQWPQEEKIRKADFVIYNDETQMILPQVLQLHSQFNFPDTETF